MVAVLIILAVVFFLISMSLHNSADKQEAKFNNRPSTITSPSNDLFMNQKYAIINILAFAQGANSISAYSDEANSILNKWCSKLGLTKTDVFVRSVYRDVDRIAQISGDIDTIEFMKELFNDILTH